MFQNREDCLFRSIRYFQPETIIDEYEKGREDALMRQTRYTEESRRVMEFFQQVRHDSLKTLTLTPVSLEEQFESREDRLYHRFVTFDPRTRALNKWSITDGTIRRTVTKIIEKFHRNEELVADRDIARREFDITNEEININYPLRRGENHSRDTVDTAAPPQKKVELFWLLEACLKAERDALKHIRDMEDEFGTGNC
ncbi:dynein regulatory complex subunit 7-like [Homalodisca vitripennis]|uniref:dynein regulatory complex subunit 7-like n=1 Tax=Homalodisca vitripennis TaxID=197043 RepID=UPI001EEA34F2|nr:dynein regulatory complex subunit 7-like [Homalodisca vitripennis]